MIKTLLTIIASIILQTSLPIQPTTTTRSLEEIVTTQATQPTLKITSEKWNPGEITEPILQKSKPRFYFDRAFDDPALISNNFRLLARRTRQIIKPEEVGFYSLVDLTEKRIYPIDLDDRQQVEPQVINVSNDKKVLYQYKQKRIILADLINRVKYKIEILEDIDFIKITDTQGNLVVQKQDSVHIFDFNGKQVFHKPSTKVKTYNEDASVLLLENLTDKTYSRYDRKTDQDLHIWSADCSRSLFAISPDGKFIVSAFNFDQDNFFLSDKSSLIDIYIHPFKFFNIRRADNEEPKKNKFVAPKKKLFIVPTRVTNAGLLGAIDPGLYRTELKFPDYEFIFLLTGKALQDLTLYSDEKYFRKKELLSWKFEIKEGKAQDFLND